MQLRTTITTSQPSLQKTSITNRLTMMGMEMQPPTIIRTPSNTHNTAISGWGSRKSEWGTLGIQHPNHKEITHLNLMGTTFPRPRHKIPTTGMISKENITIQRAQMGQGRRWREIWTRRMTVNNFWNRMISGKSQRTNSTLCMK